MEEVLDVPTYVAPPLVAEAFDKRAIVEMEIALSKACKILPQELDTHDNRCFIAKSILQRVNDGERTFGGMVGAGIAAIEQLRQRYEAV
jgi:hypothetical protein